VATDESPAPTSFTLVILHPSQGDLSSLLALHASLAAQLNRKPFVEFSADWCPPCQALAASLSDARMVEAFRGTYIIRLDLDEWKSKLARSGFTVLGVPTFFELDGDGRPSGRILTGAAWGEDIPENMAPPLKEFFQSASHE
jgi:thiol:disulfide interchange protein